MSEKLKPGQFKRVRARRGQGVVEYAGAIVIAAVLVALAMFIVPEEVARLINTITTASINFFMESLPGGGGAEGAAAG